MNAYLRANVKRERKAGSVEYEPKPNKAESAEYETKPNKAGSANNRITLLDGGMGTMLQRYGLDAGQVPEVLNITDPESIIKIHSEYLTAGSDVVYTNTFGCNRYKIKGCGYSVQELVDAAVCNARTACTRVSGTDSSSDLDYRTDSSAGLNYETDSSFDPNSGAGNSTDPNSAKRVAVSIGPLGQMLEPAGTVKFEEAYEAFQEIAVQAQRSEADFIVVETMTDLYEMKAAVLACLENTDLDVWASMSFEESGRTFTGCSIEAMATTLKGLGVSAMGINCSLGPIEILPLAKRLCSATDVPVFIKPNAGLPNPEDGSYNISADQFVETMKEYIPLGITAMGGCCGTDPGYVKGMSEIISKADPLTAAGEVAYVQTAASVEAAYGQTAAIRDAYNNKPVSDNEALSAAGNGGFPGTRVCTPTSVTRVCTPTNVVEIDHITVCGERLNPTGKKRLKQALLDGETSYILKQAVEQEDQGAEILDVNVGVPGADEKTLLPQLVKKIQSVTDLPLQIDSSDPQAIEAALRVYNGKAIVNSVNGEASSMEAILPIVKKYGAAVIALTLDEDGIPQSADKRIEIADRIIRRAAEFGIPREDIIVDCLTLTASAQQEGVGQTLDAVRRVKEELGVKTALGVSNVSFGLPNRPLVNRTFLTLAIQCGLDIPIINPGDRDMMAAVATCEMLHNRDKNAGNYIEKFADYVSESVSGPASSASGTAGASGSSTDPTNADAGSPGNSSSAAPESELYNAIAKGLEEEVSSLTSELLKTNDELEIVNDHLIPALDKIGKGFEAGRIFLPQMIQAASAAQAGFDVIKQSMAEKDGNSISLGKVVIATVKGDVHDIGKNIVKTIMENYGFEMIDLGKDVPPQDILDAVIENDVQIVGLSALMTTTLKSMEETIALLKENRPDTKVLVGGAVLTEDYAKKIGADYYCSDAMKTVAAAKECLA